MTAMDKADRTSLAPDAQPVRKRGKRSGYRDIVELFGLSINNVTFQKAFELIEERIQSGEPGYVFTPNVDHVCRVHRNAAFRNAYARAFLVLADGMPIIWTSRLVGTPLVEKVSGSDIVPFLSAYAAEHDLSVYLLGAAEGVADTAAEKLLAAHPTLRIVGTYSPPVGFESDAQANAAIVKRLREASPDIVFVALGSPKQELWIAENTPRLDRGVVIGVGASLDFVAGKVKRAPKWMQRTGLEWIWRLALEPRRLWRRYLIEDSKFLLLFCKELFQQRGRKG